MERARASSLDTLSRGGRGRGMACGGEIADEEKRVRESEYERPGRDDGRAVERGLRGEARRVVGKGK